MSLPLLIALNVLADIALLAGLAYAMSRATRLTPHVASVRGAQQAVEQPPAWSRAQRPGHSAGAQAARSRTSIANRIGARTTTAADANG